MIEYVIKRDGRKEAFDPEKLNSWGIWASKTIDPKVVNWSSVVLRTVSTLPKQVTTDELQKALIKSCIDMDTYEHNRMAGRLYADALPKQLYKDRKYPHIRDLHKEMSKKGLIRKDVNYTDEEYDRINKMIKHKRDIGYTYYSSHHIMSKYAKKDHTTKKTYETPQFVYMRVAMQTFLNYQGEDRMEKLENLYTKLSTRKINIPTPYFANSLTSNPNVASCSVLTTKDEAQSIGIGSLLAYSLTTSGAGLGLHLKTRSLGDAVRGGDIEHSGKVPYYRAYAHSIKSSKQGSRGGAGTMYFPFFDPEVITLLNLKNPLSVDSKRLRELDYALLVNKWFARKAIKKEPVWLFSYKDNPELYELFYDKDPDAFGVAMEEFAQKHKKKVTEVNASEILAACLRQSVETGRVYMMFADEANRRSPYKEKIYSSNLCTEILLPTKPYGSIEDLSSSDVDKGTVAFCNLAGIVVDNIEDDTDYEDSCYYALLMIDEGINNALLPYESLNHSIRYYRSAGVGILGLAHLMAKNKLSYKSREGLTFIHNLAEKHAYYLYKSALRLGKERGNAECMDRTLFPEGWLPIDVMNPNLGDLCDTELKYDWETLRQEIVDNGGIRFSTVSTIPPSENCLAFDTKVKTDKGDMTLKEIFDGYVDTSLDEAMRDYSPLTGGKWYELNQPLKALTASGEYHTIPRIWLNGIVKPFKITLEDGTVVKATESHKFLTDRGWVPAYDLKVGDNIINVAEE